MVSPPSLTTDVDTIKSFFPAPMPNHLYADKVTMVVSDNDPYIDIDEAKSLSEHYNIPLQIIKDAGHINAESGYGRFQLVEDMVLL